jgi:hypothetical protein
MVRPTAATLSKPHIGPRFQKAYKWGAAVSFYGKMRIIVRPPPNIETDYCHIIAIRAAV